VKTFYMRL